MAKESNKKNETKKTSTKTSNSKNTQAKKTNTSKSTVKKPKVTEKPKEKVIEEKVVEKKITPVKQTSKIDKEKNITITLLIIACLLLAIILILVIKGQKVELTKGNQVIASIDGKKIVAEDLFDDLKESYGSTALINMIDEFIVNKEITDDSEAKKSAESQLDSLKQQYDSYGYKFEDVLAQYGYDSEKDLLNEMILSAKKDEVAKKYVKESLTDDEINKYYEDEIYGDYNAKHILIKPETTDDMTDEETEKAEKKAKKKAEEVISKLNDGSKWADLVKEYSDDEGSVDDEGLIENFTKGDVVDEFFNAVLDLKDGEYTKEPVKSDYGYHVILKVSSTDKPSLKDKLDDIKDALVEQKVSEDSNLLNNTWITIREKYNLNIKDSSIKKQYKKANNK